jgi:hypothetical protein
VKNGRKEPADTFRTRHVQQMQAANDALAKRRARSTVPQKLTSQDIKKPAKEVKTTYFDVSGLSGAFVES